MRVIVYGPGCANCRRLAMNARAALDQLGLDGEITKIEDIRATAAAGVMRTPALSVDGRIATQGRVPSPDELAEVFRTTVAAL